MTPHDELMALAGKATPGEWPEPEPSRHGSPHFTIGSEPPFIAAIRQYPDAALIAAACNFVRSDAFRAMVRDAARGRYVITRGKLPTKTTAGYHYEDGVSYTTPGEAIDAAASGATTPTPPTSEGEK